MPALRLSICLATAVLAACVHHRAPPRLPVAPASAPDTTSTPLPSAPPVPAATLPSATPPATPAAVPTQPTPGDTGVPDNAASPAAPPPAARAGGKPVARRTPAKAAGPGTAAANADTSSTAPPPPAAAVQPPATAAATRPGAAPLNLASLEQRLRDTRAIGVFTKLTLKNQVDDLLTQVRAYHQHQGTTTLAQLRQKYEGLLLKVVTLLQNGDPPLASAVASSREALWAILMDPRQLANV